MSEPTEHSKDVSDGVIEDDLQTPDGASVQRTAENQNASKDLPAETQKDLGESGSVPEKVSFYSAEDFPDFVALDPSFQLSLPQFEGPLDLLLHLIRKHELDILDLPIKFVTDKYVEYIDLMQDLNLNVASEFLVMAATLAEIKSKTLLPNPKADEDGDEIDEHDPRAELIRRLLEYQKYKKAAEQLADRSIKGRDVFPRGVDIERNEEPAPLADHGVYKLIDAFKKLIDRRRHELRIEVEVERISIRQRMTQLTSRLKQGEVVPFDSLFDDIRTKYDLVVTFLALLEMAKMKMLEVEQDAPNTQLSIRFVLLDVGAEETEAYFSETYQPDHGDEESLQNDNNDEKDVETSWSVPSDESNQGLSEGKAKPKGEDEERS